MLAGGTLRRGLSGILVFVNFDCAIGIRRNQALQIRAVDFDIFVHPERDPGVLQQGVALLNEINALQKYRYALLLFDREGCGTGGSHPFRAGTEVQQQLT